VTTRQNQTYGIALGLAVTAITAFVAMTVGDTLERGALDLRFQFANHIQADPRILHVDIDDGALERIGRWPWPRDRIAELITTLKELETSTIAVDLLLDNEERPRVPDLENLSAEELRKINEENVVWPDLELANAIRRAGNVILSASFTALERDQLPPRDAAIDFLRVQPNATDAMLAEHLRLPLDRANRLGLFARMTLLLVEGFGLDDSQLAAQLQCTPTAVRSIVPAAKQAAAMILAGNFLTSSPDAEVAGFLARVMPDIPADTQNADTEGLRIAFRQQRSLVALDSRNPSFPEQLKSIAARATDVIAPLDAFGIAAAGIGFVVYHTDADGKLREMPLVADHGGRLIEQLGFNVASRVLGIRPDQMRLGPDGYLEIDGAGGPKAIRVQLDSRGRMIIPWTSTGRFWRQGQDFRHISASRLLEVARKRQLIAENERRIELAMSDPIVATKQEYSAKYIDEVERAVQLQREAHRDELRGLEGSPKYGQRQDEISKLRASIQAAQEGAEDMVESTMAEIKDEKGATPKEEALFASYRKAYATMKGRIAVLRQANKSLGEMVAADLAELRPILNDKIVFVGYTATATGDVVSTPIDPALPGVIVHANILNAFLHNVFIARPSRALQIALILALGVGATLLTATRGPVMTLFVTLGVMVAYTLLNFFALFADMRLWVVLVAPLATCIVPWAIVTAWRQLTAERQKRHVQSQLAEFTSPALARRVAEDPAAAAALNRVENREVTCFFSDLAGFTTIAEQADSAHVQEVLNTYLDRMSEVLFKYDAFLNKFLGDGIMAFFNPNVNPQPEHARLACEASLDSFEALEKLKAELGGKDELYKLLKMRIGLASGIGGVGRFGSHRKADYTVIGDVANLAARLEPANKVFGTRLLVSGPTREIVKDLYEWRYLAELQVKGKKLTVPVYELICRAGSLTDEQREFNQRFEAGVELYKQRKWDEAIVAFMRILSRRFDEPGASAYVDACQEKKTFPPEDGWNGALELKEK